MKQYALLLTTILFAPSVSATERMVVKRTYAKLRSGPGSFYEVVGLVKKGAVLEVKKRDATGRWLCLAAVMGKKDRSSDELVVLKKADAQHPMWVARLATTVPRRRAGLSKLAGLCGELRINEATCAAAIRGMDNDVEKLLRRKHLDQKTANYIVAPKFAPAEYTAFRQATLPGGLFVSLPAGAEEKAKAEVINVLTADKAGILVAAVSLKLSGALRDRIVRDPDLNRYVNMVTTLVGEASPRYDITYRTVIIRSPTVNSFSAPGGFIVITTALLDTCKSEAQLASALAHEIAHIALNHGLKERQSVASELGADVMGAFQELEESVPDREVFRLPQFQELEDMASWFYSVTIGKPRRKKEESEADTYGLFYLYRAGYDPSEMQAFLDALGRSKGYFGGLHTMVNHGTVHERIQTVEWARSQFKLSGHKGRTFADRYRREIEAWHKREGDKAP